MLRIVSRSVTTIRPPTANLAVCPTSKVKAGVAQSAWRRGAAGPGDRVQARAYGTEFELAEGQSAGEAVSSSLLPVLLITSVAACSPPESPVNTGVTMEDVFSTGVSMNC